MREAVGDYWLSLEMYGLEGIVKRRFVLLLRMAEKIFGKKLFSLRFFLRSVCFSFSVSFLMIIVANLYNISVSYVVFVNELKASFLAFIPILFNAIFDYFAMCLTIFYMKKTIISNKNKLKMIYIDSLFSSILSCVSLLVFFVSLKYVTEISVFNLQNPPLKNSSLLPLIYACVAGVILSFTGLFFLFFCFGVILFFTFSFLSSGQYHVISIVWLLASNLWPTAIFLSYLIFYYGSYFLKPVLQPVVSRITYAFYDSNKGVLTTISFVIPPLFLLIEYGIGLLTPA